MLESTTEIESTTQTLLDKLELLSTPASTLFPTEFPLISDSDIYESSSPKTSLDKSTSEVLQTDTTNRLNSKQDFNKSESDEESAITELNGSTTANQTTTEIYSNSQTELAFNFPETPIATDIYSTVMLILTNKTKTDSANNSDNGNLNSSKLVIGGNFVATLNESVLSKVANSEVSNNTNIQKMLQKRHANSEENSGKDVLKANFT